MKKLLSDLHKQLEKLGISSVLMLPIICLGLLVGVIMTFIVPRFPEVLSTYNSLTAEQQKQLSLRDKVARLEGVDKDTYRNDLIELTRLLPDSEDYSGLVYSITRFARANGLSVEDIKIDLQTKSDDLVRFQIDVRGDLESINTFLSKTKSVKRIYTPENYEVRKSDETQNEYVANLTLLAPFKAPPEVLGDSTSQVKEYSDEEKKIISDIRKFSSFTPSQQEQDDSPAATKPNPFSPD